MNDETTKVTQAIDKETIEEAIKFILEEGKERGYQEAMRIYGKQYSEVIRRGRRQGFVLALILALGGVIAWKVGKKKAKDDDWTFTFRVGPKEKEEAKDVEFEEYKEE